MQDRTSFCAEIPHRRHLRILVVDDYPDSATSMGMVLRLLGYVVEIVGDGPTALAAARRGAPDVVLLDIDLPTMSGHEVAHRLTADGGVRPFLIALTDYKMSAAKRQDEDSGIDLYLPKPVNLDLLQSMLEGRKRVLNLADG